MHIFYLVLLWMTLSSRHSVVQADYDGNDGCSASRTIRPTFHPDQLDDPANFEGFRQTKEGTGARSWPGDERQPITLSLKSRRKTPSNEFRAMVQISRTDVRPMQTSSSGKQHGLDEILPHDDALSDFSPELKRAFDDDSLFNCFIDRSSDNPCQRARDNPACCYHPSSRENHRLHPACEAGCLIYGNSNATKRSCQAVCLQAMVVQVEFQPIESNSTREGRTTISAVYKQVRLAQPEQIHVYDFSDVMSQDVNASYAVGQTVERSSGVNGDVATGYWIRWVPRKREVGGDGPYLEVGRSGEDVPYLVHNFGKTCFDCVRQDQYGWRGNEVQIPRLASTFEPRYWQVNGYYEQGDIEVGLDCDHVIYSRYQDQRRLNGPCLVHSQCRDWCEKDICRGRSCLKDEKHSGTERKTCQILPTKSMPVYIIILLVLVALILLVALLLLGLCLFYLGRISPQKRRAEHKTIQAPSLPGPVVVKEKMHPQTLEEDEEAQVPVVKNVGEVPMRKKMPQKTKTIVVYAKTPKEKTTTARMRSSGRRRRKATDLEESTHPYVSSTEIARSDFSSDAEDYSLSSENSVFTNNYPSTYPS